MVRSVNCLSMLIDSSLRRLTISILFIIAILNVAGLFFDGTTWIILHIVLCAILTGAVYVVIRSGLWNNSVFWMILIGIGMVVRCVYIFSIQIPIRSDQLKCLEAAKLLLKGDKTWVQDQYFQRWAYQIPFVLYEAAVLKLFGDVSALYVFNVIWSSVTCFLLYMIVFEATEEKLVSLIVSAMYALAPAYIMHIGLLYNNILGGCLWLSAIYVFLKAMKGKSYSWGYLLCGIILAMSQAIRSEAIILLLAILCFGIYEVVKGTSNRNRVMSLFKIGSVLVAYKLTISVFSYCVELFGLGCGGIYNHNPYWYLVCGFSPENYGEYSVQYAYILDILDPSKQREAFFQIMKEIIGGWNIKSFFKFWIGKMYRMWGGDNGPFAYGLDSSTWMQLILFLNRAIYFFTVVFSYIGMQHKDSKTKLLFTIAFLGFFFAFLFKEISVKYRYNPGLCLFVLSAFGISMINDRVRSST